VCVFVILLHSLPPGGIGTSSVEVSINPYFGFSIISALDMSNAIVLKF